MKMMIRHHWMAVIRAQQCQKNAYHVELIGMCEGRAVANGSEPIDVGLVY